MANVGPTTIRWQIVWMGSRPLERLGSVTPSHRGRQVNESGRWGGVPVTIDLQPSSWPLPELAHGPSTVQRTTTTVHLVSPLWDTSYLIAQSPTLSQCRACCYLVCRGVSWPYAKSARHTAMPTGVHARPVQSTHNTRAPTRAPTPPFPRYK